MRILPEQVRSKNNYRSHTGTRKTKDTISLHIIAREDKDRSQRESGKIVFLHRQPAHSFHSEFQCQHPQTSYSFSVTNYTYNTTMLAACCFTATLIHANLVNTHIS